MRLFVNKYPEYRIINLTYAGNLANLKDIKNQPNYVGHLWDYEKMLELMELYHMDSIIHLATESHVNRSIK